MDNEENETTWEQPAPGVDALRPFLGKVVAFDGHGVIRDSGDSWEQLIRKLGDSLGSGELNLMYVPPAAIVA